MELVEGGFNLLAGSDADRILTCVKELRLKDKGGFKNHLYGNGDAGDRILDVLRTF
ncbi:UDP-N-acetyl glucosamine 2-epimerase [Sanguibacteroides justesenii]|uniref:UDP-N-acetyl glucosamine 2-epimerase n=1 Tax=Sanguibacteroides justesenii TaxID=1547597 RepID=UPI001362440D|nr:UDP-N-acetyl glucosamine 2-epimerase [Sanguibacteroides justesenii]